MTTRIYYVSGADKPRLVRASSQAQAINHVVRNQYTASVATQINLVELLGKGVVVETASEEE